MIKINNTNGMELTSWIVNNQEVIYQKNGSWSKQDPFLFPNIGNSAQIWNHNLRKYTCPRHGIFTNTSNNFKQLTKNKYQYIHNDLSVFNYQFTCNKTYQEKNQTLKITTQITNTDQVSLPYQLGYHLAFQIDEHTKIKFKNSIYKINLVDLKSGVVLEQQQTFVTNKIWPVNLNVFTKFDSLIFANNQIDSLILCNDNYELQLNFDNCFEVVTLWTSSSKNDLEQFLCIEPWTSLPTTTKNLNYKILQPQQSKKFSYQISYRTTK